jgi:hypothetical protein
MRLAKAGWWPLCLLLILVWAVAACRYGLFGCWVIQHRIVRRI